jgi:hypothetical protein
MVRSNAVSFDSVARRGTADVVLRAVGAFVATLTIIRCAVFWPRHTYLDMAGGVWTALAFDLSTGLFYRPVVGPDGYGGTRYFPVHFVGQAGFIELIGDPLWAGYIMSAISVGLIVWGLALILRTSGAGVSLAAGAAALVLAPQVIQRALLGVRPDALAVGFAVVGLGLLSRSRTSAIICAFVLFGLSFTTKLSSVAGFVTAVVWLMLAGRRRQAAIGVATFILTVSAILGVTWIASDGRFMSALEAGVGGTRWSALPMTPFTMMRLARTVPETAVVLVIGAGVWIAAVARGRARDLPAIYWVSAMLFTLPIFAVPNTDVNHLVEPAVASVLIAGWWAVRRPRELTDAAAILAAASLACSGALVWGLMSRSSEQKWGTPAEAVALIADRSKPILAENPAVAVAAGQRAYMLDAFLFQLMTKRDPAWGVPLRDQLRDHAFSAVVLDRDPDTERGRDWYKSGFFGAGFIEAVKENYREIGRSKARVVYVPRE